MRYLHSFLGLGLVLLMQGQTAQADQLSGQAQSRSDDAPKKTSTKTAARNTPLVTSYAVHYDRYGVLGLYHVTLIVDEFCNGVHLQRLYIDGAGRPIKQELNLGFCRLKFRL